MGVISYYQDGLLHRDDGPAQIHPHGTWEWYQHGRYHRDDGPAYINGAGEWWYQHGAFHRLDGPAITRRSRSGKLIEEYWFQNDKQHRLDGPAHIYTEPSGRYSHNWYHNGRIHRDDGPAVLDIGSDGTISQLWYKNGQLHRLDGPAHDPSPAGTYYIYDNGYTEEEYMKHVANLQKFIHSARARRFVKLLTKNRKAIELFYSPDGIGGKWHKRSMEVMFNI